MQLNLNKGWFVLEDVHEFGDRFGAYRKEFDPTRFGGDPSIEPLAPWEPIPRLEYLQMLLADNPYYGRGLRQFNCSPWWYKNEFVFDDASPNAYIRFEGVDYFADVWLNEVYLGSHEGYNTPFEFEIGDIVKRGEPNLLVVKVRATWENDILPGLEYIRFCTVIRDQMKGTYEHSDTFIPRDVNPIGIWDKVTVNGYNGIRHSEKMMLEAVLNNDYSKGTVKADLSLRNSADETAVKVAVSVVRNKNGEQAAATEETVRLQKGDTKLHLETIVKKPSLWTVWERGDAELYTVTVNITDAESGEIVSHTESYIGFRDVKCYRDEKEMYYTLNGEKLYIRGTTYFPDVYISNNDAQRYLRDVEAAKRAGMNSLRVHVHAEKDEFYDLCDREGILLVQDTDFNWVHPATEEWGRRAVKMFEELIVRLKNHPSIFCWVLLNEPRGDNFLHVCPGPQFIETVKRLDPERSYILSSWERNDPESGDSHNYMGSLDGAHTHYADIYGTTEKFNTEFGMDAIPCLSTFRREPDLMRRVNKVIDLNGIEIIQYYQYRYIKYFIEHYRAQKFSPCGGHYQFLFTDPAPTSHFGVYDWLGMPKYALRAFLESNQPTAFIMETKKNAPVRLAVVNDLLKEFPYSSAEWRIECDGKDVLKGSKTVNIGSNSILDILDLSDFVPEEGKTYTVRLMLTDSGGRMIASNTYEHAFDPPEHIKGHPTYVDHGIGLRTYWQWIND